MKKLIALAIIAVSLTFSARAQLVVYDPTVNIEQIVSQAANIAKYVQMIENQVQQIETLSDQLTEFKNYEKVFGNPSSVALSTLSGLTADLQATEPGKNLDNLLSIANGSDALTYDGGGIYTSIGASFQTPDGATVSRPADEYKPFAAINRTADNFVAVADDAASRRASLKKQIAQTTQQLQSASTDAEVQKLQGVLTGLNGALASTDAEVNQAIGSALVQDIQNRTDQQKQQKALSEQQNAQFHEAMNNYASQFKLLAEPTAFPTP